MEGVGLVVKLLTGRPDVQITGRTVYGQRQNARPRLGHSLFMYA